jgi:Uma2 family endonuclease
MLSMTLPLEPNRRYTVEEYLELEGSSPQDKFEYRNGQVVNMREALAMAGGSGEHCLINANIISSLSQALKGSTCRVYSNDLRVLIPRKSLFTYPDATVVCGQPLYEHHPRAGVTLTNPRVIVEVLSQSTELYDRGDKFSLYREIPSLAEYVLISQSHPRIECYFRRDDGGWTFGPYEGIAAAAKLLSLNIELPLKEVYAGIEFPVA